MFCDGQQKPSVLSDLKTFREKNRPRGEGRGPHAAFMKSSRRIHTKKDLLIELPVRYGAVSVTPRSLYDKLCMSACDARNSGSFCAAAPTGTPFHRRQLHVGRTLLA